MLTIDPNSIRGKFYIKLNGGFTEHDIREAQNSFVTNPINLKAAEEAGIEVGESFDGTVIFFRMHRGIWFREMFIAEVTMNDGFLALWIPPTFPEAFLMQHGTIVYDEPCLKSLINGDKDWENYG